MTTTTKWTVIVLGVLALLLAPLMFHPSAVMAFAMGLGLAATVITESTRVSDVILWEQGRDIEFTRQQITVLSGTAASVIGQVLGQIGLGAVSSAAKTGGNTGAGTLTPDATTPVLANAKTGVYKVRVVAVGTFIVTSPTGELVGDAVYGAGATVTFANEIKFAFADDGTTHYVAGDGFDVTVSAGSGKWVQVNPAANDGSQNAAGILIASPFSAQLTADAVASAIVRGPAVIKTGGLAWTSGMTSGQKTAALAQLAALGITSRTDYGV